MRVNAYERITLAAARDLALQMLADNEAARSERWRNHAINSDEELAMAMDVLREYVRDSHGWPFGPKCCCPLCVRARVLLGGA